MLYGIWTQDRNACTETSVLKLGYDGAISKLDELREEFKAWEEVSRGADFPEATPAAMT
jgi:hypothetical protein